MREVTVSGATEPRTAVGHPAMEPGGPDAPPAAPVFSMLADDGAACADGVCALPDPGER